MLPTVLHLASCHHFSFPAIDIQCLLLHSYPILLFNSLFLSMLPTVSHHPSPCYHLSFPKRDFSAYFLLPFLSDLREKMFLLSSFSCLIIFLYNNNDRAGENTSTDGLRLGDTIRAVFVNVEQYLRWREKKDKYDVGRG